MGFSFDVLLFQMSMIETTVMWLSNFFMISIALLHIFACWYMTWNYWIYNCFRSANVVSRSVDYRWVFLFFFFWFHLNANDFWYFATDFVFVSFNAIWKIVMVFEVSVISQPNYSINSTAFKYKIACGFSNSLRPTKKQNTKKEKYRTLNMSLLLSTQLPF